MGNAEMLRCKREITGAEVFMALTVADDLRSESLYDTASVVLTCLFDDEVYPLNRKAANENMSRVNKLDAEDALLEVLKDVLER